MLLTMILGWTSGVRAQDALYSNRFELQDGQRPPGLRIIGPTTTDFWVVRNGRLDSGPGNEYSIGPSFAIVEDATSSSWRDYVVRSTITPLDGDGQGEFFLIARASANQTFYFGSLASTPRGRMARISKWSGGIDFDIATIMDGNGVTLPNFTQANSGPYNLEFEVRGFNLTLRVNGQVVLAAQDTDFASGSAGVGVQLFQASFDGLEVAQGAAGAPPTQPASSGPPVTTPAGGQRYWSIAILQGLTESDAKARAEEAKRELTGEFANEVVQALPSEDGFWTVYIGKYATEGTARSKENQLSAEGMLSVGIREIDEQRLSGMGQQTGRIRVLVGTFDDQARAIEAQNRLVFDGYYPVNVKEDGGRFNLYSGPLWQTRESANSYLQEIRGKGFADSSLEEGAALPPSMSIRTEVTTEDVRRAADVVNIEITSEEQRKVQELLQAQRAAAGQGDGAALSAAQREIGDLRNEVRRVYEEVARQQAEIALRSEKKASLGLQIQVQIGQRNIQAAEALLRELRQVDPNEPAIRLFEQMIADAKTASGTVTGSMREQAENLAQQAQKAQDDKQYEVALSLWEQVRTVDRSGALADQARRKIDELNEIIRSQTQGPANSGGGANSTILILAVVLSLAMLGVVVGMVFMVKKQREKDLATLAAATQNSRTSTQVPKPASVKPAPASSMMSGMPPAMAPAPMPQMPAPARGGNTPIPAHAAQEPGEDETDGGLTMPVESTEKSSIDILGLHLGDMDDQTPAEPSPSPKSVVSATSDRIRPGAMSLPPSGSPASTDDLLQLPSGDAPTTRVQPAVSMGAHLTPPTPVPQQGKAQQLAGLFYQQSFDDEAIGASPRDWEGKYDHSTLLISDGGANGGSSKCMRFEKKQGTGSAYYSLKFPDASGRICAEFDIRCDDKNRYLIGLYIEKDADFRQAISTIVHRTNPQSPPTLRLQGESAPYQFGKWVHVKYIIDLPRSLVDGWVDDVSVAAGVRLSQAPKVLNTLSIRDNSATTGILLIDNIKIYRIA